MRHNLDQALDTYLPAKPDGTFRTTGLNIWETLNAIKGGTGVSVEQALDAANVLGLSQEEQVDSYLSLTTDQRQKLKGWLETHL
jgi:hypothetical protein